MHLFLSLYIRRSTVTPHEYAQYIHNFYIKAICGSWIEILWENRWLSKVCSKHYHNVFNIDIINIYTIIIISIYIISYKKYNTISVSREMRTLLQRPCRRYGSAQSTVLSCIISLLQTLIVYMSPSFVFVCILQSTQYVGTRENKSIDLLIILIIGYYLYTFM